MKAVMANVPEHILEWRRRTGADQWDEMWEGVLHMAPSPNRDHQDIEGSFEFWLRLHWAEPKGCRVYHQINISEPGKWPNNYRIPDLVLLTPERFHIDCNEYFDGGPDAVVEIHSPGDESYEKFPFYAAVGVREVLVIDRDTKEPELYELVGGEFQLFNPDADGWIKSAATGIEMRGTIGDKLEIRIIGHDETRALLP
jgi:Uma2 family endonuclease